LPRAATPPADADANRVRAHRGRAGSRATISTGLALALALAGCASSGPKVANLRGDTTRAPASASGATTSDGGPAGGDPAGGGSSQTHGSVAIVGASPASALKFTVCMRSHGVPDFPDPNAAGVFQFGAGVRGTPQFASGSRTCMKLLHLGGGSASPAAQAQGLASLLKFSECMRSHGVPNYPDPTTSPGGGVSISVSSADGIDSHSPIFQRARQTCQSLKPGPAGAGP
jgi:hypothetical protein